MRVLERVRDERCVVGYRRVAISRVEFEFQSIQAITFLLLLRRRLRLEG